MSQLRLHVCTYNIRGFNSTKVKYINDLLKFSNILFLEELWLSDKVVLLLYILTPLGVNCLLLKLNLNVYVLLV